MEPARRDAAITAPTHLISRKRKISYFWLRSVSGGKIMSVQKKKTDQQSRAFWNFARDVSKEVEEWPLWKRQALVSFGEHVSLATSERRQRVAPRSVSHTSASLDSHEPHGT